MIGMFIINMGFDGLISFLIRNLPNDAFDDIDLNINHNKILSDYILVDISFITVLLKQLNLLLLKIFS